MLSRIALILGALALVVSVAFGPAPALSDALSSETCAKPLTQMESEMNGSVEATDRYIAQNLAALYPNPGKLDWYSENARVTPARITALVVVVPMEFGFPAGAGRVYNVQLDRKCAGGEWVVTEFVLAKGQKPEPKAEAADSEPRQPA